MDKVQNIHENLNSEKRTKMPNKIRIRHIFSKKMLLYHTLASKANTTNSGQRNPSLLAKTKAFG